MPSHRYVDDGIPDDDIELGEAVVNKPVDEKRTKSSEKHKKRQSKEKKTKHKKESKKKSVDGERQRGVGSEDVKVDYLF